jgi:carbon starvation protein
MLFVLSMSFLAGVVTLLQFFREGNYLLVVIDSIVLITCLLVILEAASVIAKFKCKEMTAK